MWGEISPILKALGLLVLLVAATDVVSVIIKEIIEKHMSWLPDKLEFVFASAIALAISITLARECRFDVTLPFGGNWRHSWEAWIFTGFVISRGSGFLVRLFGLWDRISGVWRGAYSSFSSTSSLPSETLSTRATTTSTTTQEESSL